MNIVKELRKKRGIQQKELAIEIGVAQPTVSDWESGKKDPSGERLKKLSDYFGVDELIILGKGVINLTNGEHTPVTKEAKIISSGIDKMPPDQREKAMDLMKIVFTQYADYFQKGDDE